MTDIRHQHKDDAVADNAVAYVVGAVVGNAEGGDVKLPELERRALLNDFNEVGLNLLPHAPVLGYSLVRSHGGVDRQGIVVAQTAHRAHVVGMVVGDENAERLAYGQTITLKVLFQDADANACVENEHLVIGIE